MMVAISPHAVMRHQIQRSTSTTPMPAPRSRLPCHAVWMDESWVMITRAMTRMRMLAPRATHTRFLGSGSRFSQLWHTNRL